MNTTSPKLVASKPITSENPVTEKNDADIVSRMVNASELANNPEIVREASKYGKTPVVYLPSREMMRPAPAPGLLNYIRNAKTETELESLVKRIPKFECASSGTIRKWKKAAAKRASELQKSPFPSPREGHTPLDVLVKPVKKARKTAEAKEV